MVWRPVMQGETRLTKQATQRSSGWRSGLIVVVALAAGLIAGVTQAQRGNNPPTVTLSASATSISTGTTSVLTASASDSDGTISKVVFFDGLTMLATDTTAPYQYTFAPMVAGTYTLTAIAIDNLNAQGASNPVTITVAVGTNQPPTVSLAASPTAVKVGASSLLTATASDVDGTISKVTFYDGSTFLGQAMSAPFTYDFKPQTTGTHTVTAVAFDDANAQTTSGAVSITVSASDSRNNPPTISLSATSTAIQVGTSTTLNATAADSDGTVTKVEFYNGTALLSTDTTSPYSGTFSTATAGTYSLKAVATDNSANQTTSNTVTITVTTAPAGTGLPRVTLTVNNTLLVPGATVTLSATAAATSAGATVSKVSFFQNGAKIIDDLVTPYNTTVTLPNAGTYLFSAQVTDSLGQVVSTLNQKAVVQTAPAVATTSADVWRLLNQATFGASQAEAARVVAMGIPAWINDQLTQPVSGYPDTKYNKIQLTTSVDCNTQMPNGTAYPADSPEAVCARDQLTLAGVQRDFFTNAVYAPDQLRQRVAWALSQIIVTSGNEPDLSFAHVMSRYQNLMFQEAFGNYQTLLLKVTYNPAMGNYLDMVNNDRPVGTKVPNENYAREIQQLFTINLVELNVDGTPLLDAQGKQIPTYTETDIAEFARVFTGYTYAVAAGTPAAAKRNTRFYGSPLVPYPTTATTGHDPNAKTLLNGTTLPAGQTGQQDIDAAVLNVFMHPNTGVYVGRQLIQRLVTGNPTPAYVARVTAVFNNNGSGVRGDMTAVVKAILLDTEARGGAKTASDYGSLKEPVLMVTGMLRSLSALSDGNRLEGSTSNLNQRPFYSPTVFNYFMPDSKIPGTNILAPEFGIHNTVSAVGRANLVYQLVYGGFNPDTTIPDASGTKLFLAQFESLATTPAAMVSQINKVLAGGQFPAALEPTIVTAVNAITLSATPTAQQLTDRARMAVYLMASSYDYQVAR
jgi:uncharacterized protein (DUF1800 family)